MEVEQKSNVAFMTTQDRQMYPTHVPPTRFGNEMTAIRGAPNRGPGCYNNEEVSNFWYKIQKHITSERGYSLGARTAPRLQREPTFKTPAPTAYQGDTTKLQEFDPAYKPFSVGATRFPIYKRDVDDVTPGPGTYEHNSKMNRKVQWHASFGGAPINLPLIDQHSTIPQNTEKLMSTKDQKKYSRRLAYLKLYYD